MAEKSLQPLMRLDGKVVMVTGASSGLGRDFCLDLAKAGCKIVAAARRIDRLNSLCEEINQFNFSSSSTPDRPSVRSSFAVQLDVTAAESVIDAAVQKAWDAFGRIDTLVNNAGFRGNVRSALDLTEEEWDKVLKTNITGSLLVAKSVCRRMRDANVEGSIVNISSISGLARGLAVGAVAYTASKAVLDSMTEVMALEFGVHKIRVNSIAPGLFRSEITKKLMQKEWINGVAEKIVPLRTWGDSDPHLTSLVRYLIHDSSAYVTGNIFIADGGTSLPGIPIYSSL
ncbi:uncharacterized protein [Aristolochia californica]|uniref:uncharacterized protein n=1 Tax=Aristolochia californica TaxID=171875 RepID=UPI0035DA2AE9